MIYFLNALSALRLTHEISQILNKVSLNTEYFYFNFTDQISCQDYVRKIYKNSKLIMLTPANKQVKIIEGPSISSEDIAIFSRFYLVINKNPNFFSLLFNSIAENLPKESNKKTNLYSAIKNRLYLFDNDFPKNTPWPISKVLYYNFLDHILNIIEFTSPFETKFMLALTEKIKLIFNNIKDQECKEMSPQNIPSCYQQLALRLLKDILKALSENNKYATDNNFPTEELLLLFDQLPKHFSQHINNLTERWLLSEANDMINIWHLFIDTLAEVKLLDIKFIKLILNYPLTKSRSARNLYYNFRLFILNQILSNSENLKDNIFNYLEYWLPHLQEKEQKEKQKKEIELCLDKNISASDIVQEINNTKSIIELKRAIIKHSPIIERNFFKTPKAILLRLSEEMQKKLYDFTQEPGKSIKFSL